MYDVSQEDVLSHGNSNVPSGIYISALASEVRTHVVGEAIKQRESHFTVMKAYRARRMPFTGDENGEERKQGSARIRPLCVCRALGDP